MGDVDTTGVPDLREHLLTRILPFWERHSVDRDHGGFITHLARDGTVTESGEKFLVAQTRMVYSFATGAALGGPAEWMNLARQGVGFLLTSFRDVEHDGWFWSVSRRGEPLQTVKRAYGQAFAGYALAEYGRIASDSRALAAAHRTCSLTIDHLWDAEEEGLVDTCERDWTPTNRRRTMGTHLHGLEALLALREVDRGDHYLPYVRTLCDLIVTRMVEPQHQCGLEHFHHDWRHDAEAGGGLINYGHNLEAAWLLLRVAEAEGEPAYREAARSFLSYVLAFGLDTVHGGVFSHGPAGQPATIREKIWWVQTEALVAFLLGYLTFDDERYWEAFRNVAGFCVDKLHDREHGEWYQSTHEDGTPRDETKGSAWKAAYHVTQACAYVHEYLSRIGR